MCFLSEEKLLSFFADLNETILAAFITRFVRHPELNGETIMYYSPDYSKFSETHCITLGRSRGGQVCNLVVPSLSTNSLKIATRICQFSQYLGTKLDMLFEIAKSVEVVIVVGKTFEFLILCKNIFVWGCPVSPRMAHHLFQFFLCSVSGANLAYVLLTRYVKMLCSMFYQIVSREVIKHHNSHCLKTSTSDNPRLLSL